MKVQYLRDIWWFIDKDERVVIKSQRTNNFIATGTMIEVIACNTHLASADWLLCNIRAQVDEKGPFLEIVVWLG